MQATVRIFGRRITRRLSLAIGLGYTSIVIVSALQSSRASGQAVRPSFDEQLRSGIFLATFLVLISLAVSEGIALVDKLMGRIHRVSGRAVESDDRGDEAGERSDP